MLYSIWKKNSCLLVYIAILLLAISDTGIQLLLLHSGIPNSRILRKLAMTLLFIKVVGTRFTKKEVCILFPISVLSLYNYTLCGDIYSIYNILIIACMKDVDYSTLFKTLFFGTFSTLCLIGLLSLCGIGSDFVLTQNFGRGSIETRYCFGLYHPNIWHQTFSRCIVFFILAYYRSIKWSSLTLLFIVNCIAFYFTLSRTGLITVTIFLLLVFLYKYLPKFMHWLPTKLCILGTLIGSYACFLYFLRDYGLTHSELSKFVNSKLTTGRISQAYKFFLDHSVSLFGNVFPDNGFVFDCGFLRYFYTSGYLLAAILFIMVFVLLMKSLKYNYDCVIPVIFFILLYGFYEVSPMTRAPYNILIFFLAIIIFPKQKELLNL